MNLILTCAHLAFALLNPDTATEKTFYPIETPLAPKAIGPFSQAVVAGDFVYVSGQLPIDPRTGALVQDFGAATHQIFDNLEAILAAQNLTLNDVVRAEVFLKDMNDFQQMNGIYAERFKNHKPARQTVEVARLPKDAKIEISCIAYKPQ